MMFDTVTVLASASVVITFLSAIVGYIARLWYSHKRMIENQEKINKRIDTLESMRYLTIPEHDRERQICRAEVYKDISALESAIVRIENRLDKSEEQRDKAREEDLAWKTAVAKNLTEISTLLKNELYHQRLGDKKGYEGP